MKRCKRCGIEKPEEAFGKNKNNTDGLDHYCRDCRKAYRLDHHEAILEAQAKYRDTHREQIREKANASYSYVPHPRVKKTEEEKREYVRQYYQAHREEKLLYRKEYYQNNKEKCEALSKDWSSRNQAHIREYKKKWRDEHRDEYRERHKAAKHSRRAKIKGNGGSFSKEELQRCLLFFDNRCAYTGEPLEQGYHLDHIVPLAKGGTNYIKNIVPSNCIPNCDKSDKDMEPWYREQDYFSEERLERIKAWMG